MNSNEKMAIQINGMEGTGKHFTINGQAAEEILHNEKVAKFNQAVDDLTNKFDKHNKDLESYAENLSKDLNGLEIMPIGRYALIKPFDNNPFQKIEKIGTIITDLGGYAPEYKSNETGKIEEEERFIKVGTVIETGPKCEFLRAGDIVFYTIASEMMVPFYKFGFVVVDEYRIIAVVNEKLTERKING